MFKIKILKQCLRTNIMEFNFDINEIIPYEISVYDYNLNIINTLNAFDEDDRPILTRYFF